MRLKETDMAMSDLLDTVKMIASAMDEKKAEDIKAIDISRISIMADCFIIATGHNPNQIKAIIDNIRGKLAMVRYPVNAIEGSEKTDWILMDCGDIIIHIFSKEAREFYDLERIWRDGEEIAL